MSDDIHALSGAYAVDALDDAERAQFERHLAGCDICQEEVDSLREASALLAETTMVTPRPELRNRVLTEIRTVRPLPPLGRGPVAEDTPEAEDSEGSSSEDSSDDSEDSEATATTTDLGARRAARAGRVRRFPALLAAAAAVVAVGVGSAVVLEPWQDNTSTPAPSAVDRIQAAEDAQVFRHTFEDGSKAVLYRSASLNEAVLVTEDMASAPDGKVYQAWLQHDETMVSAGLMPEGPDNTVPLQGQPATADGFGITVEPAGGSVVPSPPTVLYIPFEKA
ncbi:anti-sigma factor [Nocardioides sp. SYSU DS0663]|uniref:anti-sigma factor n=1 Tax=Nocardioides sp. SYSU DS0663 TaxID=3416445 RepID=UPI003F4C6823